MKGRKKYFSRKGFTNIPKAKMREHLENTVFNTSDFNLHITRVACNLKLDESIVRDVVQSYFLHIAYTINTIRKIKTKINVYGYFSLWVEKGNRL